MSDEVNKAFEGPLKRPDKPKPEGQSTQGKPVPLAEKGAAQVPCTASKVHKPRMERRVYLRYPVSVHMTSLFLGPISSGDSLNNRVARVTSG